MTTFKFSLHAVKNLHWKFIPESTAALCIAQNSVPVSVAPDTAIAHLCIFNTRIGDHTIQRLNEPSFTKACGCTTFNFMPN